MAHCCSVTQLYPTLCNPVDCSMPGFPVNHQLLELAQTHVHPVGDVIQPSHPLSPLLLLPSIFPSVRVFSNEVWLPLKPRAVCTAGFAKGFPTEGSCTESRHQLLIKWVHLDTDTQGEHCEQEGKDWREVSYKPRTTGDKPWWQQMLEAWREAGNRFPTSILGGN